MFSSKSLRNFSPRTPLTMTKSAKRRRQRTLDYEPLQYDAKIKNFEQESKITTILDEYKILTKSEKSHKSFTAQSNTQKTEKVDLEQEIDDDGSQTKEFIEPLGKNSIKVLNWLFQNPSIEAAVRVIDQEEETDEDESQDIIGIEGLLSLQEISKFRSPECRLSVNGHSFVVQMNKNKGDSFYRSLAQALTKNEENRKEIRVQLCSHVIGEMWSTTYLNMVKEYFLRRKHCPISANTKSKRVAKIYQNECLKRKNPGSYFQLRAASNLFNFNFSLVFKRNNCFTWLNYKNNSSATEGCPQFFFLIWSLEVNKSPLWKLLVPINHNNEYIETPDGNYPLYMRRTFNVNKRCFTRHHSSSSNVGSSKPSIISLDQQLWSAHSKIITFQAGDDELAFPLNNLQYPQDLFSLLSSIFFGNTFHSQEIKQEIMEHRTRFNYFMNLNPQRKHTSLMPGSSLFILNSSSSSNALDLKIAASLYKFCYTIVSMDSLGNLSMNFECRDPSHSPHIQDHIPYLAFFTRVTSKQIWFKLEPFLAHHN